MNTKNPQIIDLHTDFILGEADLGKKIFNINTSKQISKNLATKGNYQLLSAGFSYDDEQGCTETMLSEMESFVRKNKTRFEIVFHLEGAGILAKDSDLLRKFYTRGVRSIGLAHTHSNALCGSSSDVANKGLAALGTKVLKEALKLGMVIDLAHMSDRALMQTLKVIDKPPILSHTACFSIEPNPRNTKDRIIREIAKRKGVIGVFFSNKYINSRMRPSVVDVANHIDHVVKIGGIDTVAIGSDFGGITTGTPKGLESAAKFSNLFNELSKRGYSKKNIEKIAYKNATRVLSFWGIRV